MKGSNPRPKTLAIIAAAGAGLRFGGKKQFAELAGKPILARSASAILSHPWIAFGVILVPEEDVARTEREIVKPHLENFSIPIEVVAGGVLRQDSVVVGLGFADRCDPQLVVIHDGVRPLVEASAVNSCLRSAQQHGAATVAAPATDTIKQSVNENFVEGTLDRSRIWLIQTPQAFRREVIIEAHRRAGEEGIEVTDDCTLVERYQLSSVALVDGGSFNIKITEPVDVAIAEAVISYRSKKSP